MPSTPISAVIPNRDGADLLRRILPPLLSELPLEGNEILVVDDASADGSAEMLRREFPGIGVRALSENVGFGEACNLGFREAKHDLVLLLNSDMEVTPGSLAFLREHFADDRVFAAGPRHQGDGAPEPAADPRGFWHQLGAPAGGGLFRREFFLGLGGFDPLYHPFYWEDVDLGWNAWRRGWEIIYDSRCRFLHLESATISRLYNAAYVERIRTRNRCLFGWKNLRSPAILIPFHARTIARALSGVTRRRTLAPLLGALDSMARVPPALRRRLSSVTGRSDAEILRDSEAFLERLQRL